MLNYSFPVLLQSGMTFLCLGIDSLAQTDDKRSCDPDGGIIHNQLLTYCDRLSLCSTDRLKVQLDMMNVGGRRAATQLFHHDDEHV